jgi:putative protease
VNYAGVKFWQSQGIERIILSRELSLTDIEEIRQECPEIELEVFVHGALCIAYSGRCLLSGYFNHRDPNQGACTNSCRWEYKTIAAQETQEGKFVPRSQIISENMLTQGLRENEPRHPLADDVYFLEESNRPGELMPVFEDEHGTYIMNSRDLRAIEHVQRLMEIGVDCLKIEGRTKSHYYVARTAQAYRQAIDDAAVGKAFDERLLGVLENLANRGYTDGFYQRQQTQEHQNYMANASKNHRQVFCAEMINFDTEKKLLELDVKNKFQLGDRLELITPDGNNQELILKSMQDMQGNAIDVAPGSGYKVKIPASHIQSDKVLVAKFL